MKKLVSLVGLLFVVLGSGSTLAQTSTEEAGEVSQLVGGNTAFAFDLYQAVREGEHGNLFFSPYSVSQALAMTYAGARGSTADQMAETLSFLLEPPTLHEAFQTVNAALIERGNAEADEASGQPARILRIANSLWGEQTFPFSPAYLGLVEQYYGGGWQLTDFINAPEEARQQINDWVADETEDRIQNIVPEGALTSATRLALANAIYFKNAWMWQFSPQQTADDEFFLLDGSTVTTPFMTQVREFNYTRGENYQAVEFPYYGGMSMLVIMPDEGAFESFETSLDAETLNAVVTGFANTRLHVYLPKFEFDYGVSLSSTLQAMGMTDAFSQEQADFTGMIEGEIADRLFISDVLHKAFVAVDENGAEAAAATVVIMSVTAAQVEPVEPIEVRIDHPFIFAIRDQQTGSILFLGRVVDPSS